MVNGTTYAKKLRLNIRNGNIVIDIKKINHRFLTFQAINKPFIILLMLI